MINGEKASYCTPTFSEKKNRTLNLLLKDVEQKCTTEVREGREGGREEGRKEGVRKRRKEGRRGGEGKEWREGGKEEGREGGKERRRVGRKEGSREGKTTCVSNTLWEILLMVLFPPPPPSIPPPPLLQYRRALSVPVIKPQPTTPSSQRKYAELEHSFTDYGQRLKVEKIITGHHPTSQRTTVSPKRDVSVQHIHARVHSE